MTPNDFMNRAISLALKGKGWTNPNPLVGAVIVRDGKIIAEGYHHKYGELHAERDALKNAADNGVDVKGATIYVTLEPCCHQGKQPPCTQAIIDSGIKRVVIGSHDPNPLVSGKGAALLREKGIEVEEDFMREECDAINPVFFHYITTKRPYVILKYAMTMDGQTATSSGKSQWITGEKARANVHKTRAEVMAVMCGIGTVLKDDPLLNVRAMDNGQWTMDNVRQPVRVVLDSDLRIPLESQLVKSANSHVIANEAKQTSCGRVVVFCAEDADSGKKCELERCGIEVIVCPLITQISSAKKLLDLDFVMKTLGERGIDSVLVESGGRLNASLLFSQKNLVNEVHLYIAPKIFGNNGGDIFNPVRGLGVDCPDEAVMFGKPEVEVFGDDLLLKYSIKN